jgi:protein-arginine kinase activator protein McsA
MIKTKKCLQCNKNFSSRADNHKFCKKRCYSAYYIQHIKEITKKYPDFICQWCKVKTELDFNPKTRYKRWRDFVCPSCGKKRREGN